ncbi:MAG: hypothetical protein IT376_17765 [Polyangiaceae bacterium]|nr:hypothetical protein [Polyangiaceae bacterium]
MRTPSKSRHLPPSIALAVVVGVACAGAPPRPEFTGAGVEYPAFGVRIAAEQGSFVGPGWRVDNIAPGSRGKPSLKSGGEYVTNRVIDFDSDGQIGDDESTPEPTYDLRLRSDVDDGDLWVKAHPLLVTEAGKSLEVLLAGYVDALAQSGDYARGAFFSPLAPQPRRFRAEAGRVTPLLLAGRPALGAVVSLVDAASPPGAPPSLTIAVVLAKYGHLQVAGMARRGRKPPEAMWPVTERSGRWVVERTALLVVGYANRAPAFARRLPAFEKLQSRVSFDRSTYALESPATYLAAHQPPAAPPALPVPPPSAEAQPEPPPPIAPEPPPPASGSASAPAPAPSAAPPQ